jgi:hypothetical protein
MRSNTSSTLLEPVDLSFWIWHPRTRCDFDGRGWLLKLDHGQSRNFLEMTKIAGQNLIAER